MQKDENNDVRRRAAEALGRIGGEKAVKPLITALAKDKADVVRGSVAEALGMIGGEKAVETLITALAKDENNDVRRGASGSAWNDRGRRLLSRSLPPLQRTKLTLFDGEQRKRLEE